MDDQKSTQQKKQASHFMAFYIVGLFSIALVLILLSYLTQARADDQIAHAETQLQEQVSATQGIQAKMEILQEANNDQAQRIAALEQSLSRAMDENEMLEKRAGYGGGEGGAGRAAGSAVWPAAGMSIRADSGGHGANARRIGCAHSKIWRRSLRRHGAGQADLDGGRRRAI